MIVLGHDHFSVSGGLNALTVLYGSKAGGVLGKAWEHDTLMHVGLGIVRGLGLNDQLELQVLDLFLLAEDQLLGTSSCHLDLFGHPLVFQLLDLAPLLLLRIVLQAEDTLSETG